MAAFSSALEVKRALIDVAVLAIGDDRVLVCNGHPGQYQPDDIVSFNRVTWSEEPATLSTRMVRDLTVQVSATISVYRGGGPEQEQVCEDRCLELADLISEHVRAVDPKLGDRALWCFRTSYESLGSSSPDITAKGRVIEATVVFTARCRISS
jgi:hypothetical protein